MSDSSSATDFSVPIREFDYPVLRTFVTSLSRDILKDLKSIKDLPVLTNFTGCFKDEVNITCGRFIQIEIVRNTNRGRFLTKKLFSTGISRQKRRINPTKLCINGTKATVELPAALNNFVLFHHTELDVSGFTAPVSALKPLLAPATEVTIYDLTIVGQFNIREFLEDVKYVCVLDVHFANKTFNIDDLKILLVNPSKTFESLALQNVDGNVSEEIIHAIANYPGRLSIDFNGKLPTKVTKKLDALGVSWQHCGSIYSHKPVTWVHIWKPV